MTTKTKSKATTATTKTAKPPTKRAKAAKPAEQAAAAPAPEPQAPAAPKLSALDAAAKVLAEANEALGCGELIGRMAVAGYWRSPAGRTPAATLHAAITREIKVKGEQSRFKKAGR